VFREDTVKMHNKYYIH